MSLRSVFQFLVLVCGVPFLAAAAVLLQTHLASAQPGQMLEGSWISDVTNVETGARQITFYTFISDGSLLSSNRDHPTRGPGHGAWVRTGDREFATTFVRLRFGTEGNFIGTQKARAQITLNEALDEFTSRTQSDFFDVAGSFESSNRTTGSAKRIKVEPLP